MSEKKWRNLPLESSGAQLSWAGKKCPTYGKKEQS